VVESFSLFIFSSPADLSVSVLAHEAQISIWREISEIEASENGYRSFSAVETCRTAREAECHK
jgi:hypothetical protein